MVFLCKAAGAVLIMGASGYFAINLNRIMDKRNLELRKLYSILLQLKSEIQYMCNTLPECFSKLAGYEKEPFKTWLTTMAQKMEERDKVSFSDIWRDELLQLYKRSSLEKEDIEPLKELADKLGSMDTTAQIKAIDYALLHIERNRMMLEGEISQRKKVIVTLSLFCGFMTLILLL